MELEKWDNLLFNIKKKGRTRKRVHKIFAAGISMLILTLGLNFYILQNQPKELKKQQFIAKSIELTPEEQNANLYLTLSSYHYDQDLDLLY